MKKREMRELLYQGLEQMLVGTGFRLKRSDEGFVRAIPGGKQMVGVPLWDYNPQFEFSLNIGIRLEALEDVFHLIAGTAEKYRSLSYSTQTTLEYFTQTVSSTYRVCSVEEVASVLAGLSSVMRHKIVPFLDEHMDVRTLDNVVNVEDPLPIKFDNGAYPWRALRSVIIARFAGNPGFDCLVNKHLSDMQLDPKANHPFNRLVTYLREH